MNKNKQIIGLENAKICFYLPTPPTLEANWSHTAPLAVQNLIKINGNHWRKILTIMAKIAVANTNWKRYRDELLLKQDESILIDSVQLNPNASVHIICGQLSAQKLNLNSALFKPITSDSSSSHVSKHTSQAIYLCPYLDYRQFPNQQIDILRAALTLPPLS
ncbi:hypothetical protein L2719_15650 [Shewanella schlegeliana]|uniref:Uncharacterized protein n=1 Tax=Shewanella schlegeliana TaxID=190308 RepID=A0ABS1T2Z1_9GAMM|nr:hypothetical protein [Shewanella schlegeliana]MBL4915165.1 hypothetical protein [Shewanella schlegeliana]MCL1110967.1 hypothetical protein [Shewanella schlegeliana]GIU29402.1 hypothetical protein TUM4433_18670 [Shewanella schlegeliana]